MRWYCRYGIGYRDLEEMMSERGVTVDHTTLYRWVQRYAPIMEKRIRWYQRYTSPSWHVDETHIKFAGEWAYLYRALDADGRPIRRSRARPGSLAGLFYAGMAASLYALSRTGKARNQTPIMQVASLENAAA